MPAHVKALKTFNAWLYTVVDQAEAQAILAQEQRNHQVSLLHSIRRPFLLRRIEVAIASICRVL